METTEDRRSTSEGYTIFIPPTRPTRTYPSHAIDVPYGKALAASSDLEAGVAVEQFVGDLIRYDEATDEEKRYVIWADYPDKYIMGRSDAIAINSKLEIVTMKPVKKGEEITYHYNVATEDGWWDPLWTFECKCGSDNCMKLINCYVDKNLQPFKKENK